MKPATAAAMLDILALFCLISSTRAFTSRNPTQTSTAVISPSTTPPPESPPLGDPAGNPAAVCASSWWAWRNSSASHHADSDKTFKQACASTRCPGAIKTWETSSFDITYTKSELSTRTFTECDGIPRISITTTYLGLTTSVKTQSWPVVLETHTPQAPFTDAPPTCTLEGNACAENYWRLANLTGSRNDITPFYAVLNNPDLHSDFFGCKPPADLCEEAFGRCVLGARKIFLIYFQPKIKYRDICANGGRGLFVTEEARSAPGAPPVTTVLDNITFDDLPHGLDRIITMPGPFTFTSPTVYMAYEDAYAWNTCSVVGQEDRRGIVAIPPEQLKTIDYKPWFWDKSELEWAQAYVKDPELQFVGKDVVPRLVDLAAMIEPIPAVNYFLHLGEKCHDPSNGNCSRIIEGNYFPEFEIPDVFKQIDPAWKSCTVRTPVWDPQIVFTAGAQSAPAPTISVHAKPTSRDNIEPTKTPSANPGSVASAAGASETALPTRPTDSSGAGNTITSDSSGDRVGDDAREQPVGPNTPVNSARPAGADDLRFLKLSPWKGAKIRGSATVVTATPIAGNPGVVEIGPNVFVADGPGYVMDGEVVSFAPGGLLVGTRTISVVYGPTATLQGDSAVRVASMVAAASVAETLGAGAGDNDPDLNTRGANFATTGSARASESVPTVARAITTSSTKSGACRTLHTPNLITFLLRVLFRNG